LIGEGRGPGAGNHRGLCHGNEWCRRREASMSPTPGKT